MKRGWKIVLGVTLILTTLIAFLLFFQPVQQILVYSVPLCNTSIEKTLKTLIDKDFPTSWRGIFSSKIAEVTMVNDMRCELEEYMANLGIILEDSSKILFGIFHIHFSRERNLLSSAAIIPWTQVLHRSDPQIDILWHDFIKIVYPEEMNPTHN